MQFLVNPAGTSPGQPSTGGTMEAMYDDDWGSRLGSNDYRIYTQSWKLNSFIWSAVGFILCA